MKVVEALTVALITACIMHAVTLVLLIRYPQTLDNHITGVKDWLGNSCILTNNSKKSVVSLPQKPIVTTDAQEFDEMFGVVTGIEAIDESYQSL